MKASYELCPECLGEQVVAGTVCPECEGTGVVTTEHAKDIRAANAAFVDQQMARLRAEGRIP